MNEKDVSTVDQSSSVLSRDQEESLDRYRVRLRDKAITPRQWIKENSRIEATPTFKAMLWSHYRLMYPLPSVPGFEIIDVLGQGGMGRVFLATDQFLPREVAIKELIEKLRGSNDAAERMRKEAKILAQLDHPNIVKILQFIPAVDGREFIAMDYLSGGSLADRMSSFRNDYSAFSRLLAKIARAIGHVHSVKNIVHRDLKPSNILFGNDDEPRISDFGLAKDLDDPVDRSHGVQLGTDHYMAPEQVEGKTPVVGTDLWALGVILYRILAGQFPFNGTTDELHKAIRTASPAEMPRKVPAELRRICLRCLEKDAKLRYQSGNDLANDLEKAAARKPTPILRWAAAAVLAIAVIWTAIYAAPALLHLVRHSSSAPSIVMREKLPGPSRSIAISADGDFAYSQIASSHSQIAVWDLRKAQLAKPFHDHAFAKPLDCGSLAVSDDGKLAVLATNSASRELRVFELIDAKTLERLHAGLDLRFRPALAIAADGKHVAAESFEPGVINNLFGTGKTRLSLFDVSSTKWNHIPVSTELSCIAFSASGQLVAAGSHEPTISIWSWVLKAKESEIPGPVGGIDSVAFSKDDSRIYAASIADSSLNVYSVTGKRDSTWPTHAATSEKITCAAFSPLGDAVTGHRDGTIVAWDLSTGNHQSFYHAGGEVMAIAISKDGLQIVASFGDQSVALIKK